MKPAKACPIASAWPMVFLVHDEGQAGVGRWEWHGSRRSNGAAGWAMRVAIGVLVLAILFLVVAHGMIPFLILGVWGMKGPVPLLIHQRPDGWKAAVRALEFLRLVAESGDPTAQFRLGMDNFHGTSQAPPDTVAARHWVRQAAEGGRVPAMGS